MASRLPFLYESTLRVFSHDILRNSGAVLFPCASCASIRNSSTFLLRSRTAEHLSSIRNHGVNLIQTCGKANWKNPSKKKASTEYDSGSDSDEEDFVLRQKAKTVGIKVTQIVVDNLRFDGILKHAFGISRNKLDVLFYHNMIRINGKKPMKKGVDVNIGDEVDIVKGVSSDNENFIVVSRVEVLRIRPSGDYLALTIRKQKNMTVENYDGEPWIANKEEETTEQNRETTEENKELA